LQENTLIKFGRYEVGVDLNLNFLLSAHIINKSDAEKYDKEVESIVLNLWANSGELEELISPFFRTYLQNSVLRPLYIYFVYIKNLLDKKVQITQTDTLSIIDIIFDYYKLPTNPKRLNHDYQFLLGRVYSFNNRSFAWRLRGFWGRNFLSKRNPNIIYADSGKLLSDLKKIKGIDYNFIPYSSNFHKYHVDGLVSKSLFNISKLSLSVPYEVIRAVLYRYVYDHLEKCFLRIEDYKKYIRKNNIKLILISAPTHEDHLALLVAAKQEKVPSLIIGHGYAGGVKNAYLDGYVSYQATINSCEYIYQGARNFHYGMRWFNEKKI
jgi:hypothetical protein